MTYPLMLRFKFFALTPQVYVQDATGAEIAYVKQRLFRLREKVEVYANASRSALVATIAADRIIDFNAVYRFQMGDGRSLGCIRRRGLRSLWSAHYEILDEAGTVTHEMREINPMVKFVDGLLGDIPIVGLFTGYFLHPQYEILRHGAPIVRITKSRSLIEGRFIVEKLGDLEALDETRIVLSLLMFVLMERSRG